jgi:hypothetical protein
MAPADNHVAPGYLRMNGTSFAAPQVAGSVALLLQKHPDWTPDQLKWLLTSTVRPLAGSAAGALDIPSALAFAGVPALANQGLTPSQGADTSSIQSSLNGAAAGDAASWERAAQKLEADQQWEKAGDAWRNAAHIWGPKVGAWINAQRDYEQASADYGLAAKPDKAGQSWLVAAKDYDGLGALQIEALAFDRAASAFAQAKLWDKAATAWEASGDALARSTTADWAFPAFEYAANAWGQKGEPKKAAADWYKAAAGWQQLAAGNVDKYAVYRAASWGYWNAAGYWKLAGQTSQSAIDQMNASNSWNSTTSTSPSDSAAWNAAADWNSAGGRLGIGLQPGVQNADDNRPGNAATGARSPRSDLLS